ncbi:type III effector protein [Streptomyces sp. NPDC057418]|uniref:type III effector protein n=1 Tax=Streptomyces sp. NPDC057418 TaxID=3346126 RepID=UPI003690E613
MQNPARSKAEPGAPSAALVALGALNSIEAVVAGARSQYPGPRHPSAPSTPNGGEALAALLLLREVRQQLAAWEPGLIEEARASGVNWADLAGPLGVTSRQAAERRYLRLRPGPAGSTGEQRVQATRDDRAALRSVAAWARENAADLRQLAGQITALTDLPAPAKGPVTRLAHALAQDDPALLVAPLSDTHDHVRPGHADLAARIADVTRRAESLRLHSNSKRRNAL